MGRGINRKILDFVIFSNLFIAACAVLMAHYTYRLFGCNALPLRFTAFIFLATLSSYSIHWYLTAHTGSGNAARGAWLGRHQWLHAFFFCCSAAGTLIFLWQERQQWPCLLPAILLTALYTAPKLPGRSFKINVHYFMDKTLLLAGMWAYVTAVLPLLLYPIHYTVAILPYIVGQFLLLYAVCLLFDLRDREPDREAGIASTVVNRSSSYIKRLFTAALAGSMAMGVVAAAITAQAAIAVAAGIPAVLTFVLYRPALQSRSDYIFYFILDGLIALPAILYFALNSLMHFIK